MYYDETYVILYNNILCNMQVKMKREVGIDRYNKN